MSVGLLAAPLAVWAGTAQVDVMIWEPSGQHPYTTDFTLEYSEESSASDVSLVPRRVGIDVRHEVQHADGGLICSGGGREIVKSAPNGTISLRANPGLYQIVLPRAVGAFACGSKVNARDRQVVIGSGLFEVPGEVDAADTESRRVTSGGSVVQGEYRSSDAARKGAVRHDYHVRWHLRKRVSP